MNHSPIMVTVYNGRFLTDHPTTHNVSSCAGCAAARQDVSRELRHAMCASMPPCAATDRADGRNVIWIEEAAR